MKKLVRHSKSLIAVLLTLIMLVGSAMPAVAATVEGVEAMSARTASDNKESVGGSADLEWLEVAYDNEGIVITVAPEFEALLDIDKAQLKSVLDTFKGALETLVIEKIKDSWRENNNGSSGDSSSTEGITLKNVWKESLESYIDKNYHDASRANNYIAFFDDMMNDDAKLFALVEHVCDLIALSVSAGVIEPEELPLADEALAEEISETLDDFIHDYIKECSEDAIDRYIDDIINKKEHGTSKLDVFAQHFVENHFLEAVEDYLRHKSEPAGSREDYVIDKYIDDYIDEAIQSSIEKYVSFKVDGVAVGELSGIEAKAYDVMSKYVSDYVKEVKDDYVAYKLGSGEVPDAKILAIMEGFLSEYNPENRPLDGDGYQLFKDYVTEEKVLSEIRKEENREVFNESLADEIARLESDIAKKFFDEYGSSDDIEGYIDGVVGFVTERITEEDKAEIVESVANSEGLFGEALVELFGMGSTEGEGTASQKAVEEFLARKEYMTEQLLFDAQVNYKDTRDRLIAEPPQISVKDLLNTIESVSITGDLNHDGGYVGGVLLQNGNVNRENVTALIKDFPTITEISEMSPEDMYITVTISIQTSVGDAEFDLTLRLDPDEKYHELYGKIQLLLILIDDHVSVSYSNRELTVDVILPAVTTKALTRILNSDVIGDELKEKVYALAIGDLDGAKRFFEELTFEEAKSLIAEIDFEQIFDEIERLGEENEELGALLDKVKQKFDYTKITNEQILEKFEANKSKFNKIKSKAVSAVDKLYSRVPSDIKDKTIADFHKGTEDGYATFGFDFSYSKSFAEIERKIIEACPEEYEGEMVYILDLVKQVVGNDVSGALDFSVSVPDVAKITYKIGDTKHRVGFLPKGVNPQKFSGISEYLGVEIVGWADGEGNIIDKMPDTDTVLYAVLAQDVTVGVIPENRSFTYNGQPHYLEVKVVYGESWRDRENTEVSVIWYEGELAVGTPISTAERLAITDIGSYTYSLKVTVKNDYGEKTFVFDNGEGGIGAISAAVTAPEVNADAVITDKDGNELVSVDKTYSDDEEYTLRATLDTALAEITGCKWYFVKSGENTPTLVSEALSYTVKNVRESGVYYAEVSYSVNGKAQGSITSDTVEIKISPISVALSDIWNTSIFGGSSLNAVTYTGEVYSVVNDTVLGKSATDIFDLENCKASAVGSYVAKVTVKDDNYVISGGANSSTLSWHIIGEITVLVTLNGQAPENPANITIEETYRQGLSYKIEITVGDGFDGTSISWYKQNGEGEFVIENSLSGEYCAEFSNAESAVYKWVLTTTKSGVTQTMEGLVKVEISPAAVSLDGFTWSGDNEFTYNGEGHTPPTLVGNLPTDLLTSITYTVTLNGTAVDEIKKPGEYEVSATLSITEHNPNYTLGTATAKTIVTVNKAPFDISDVHWDYTEPFIWSGEAYSVSLVGFESYPGVRVKYSDSSVTSATGIGKYTAQFLKFVVIDGDEELVFEDYYYLDGEPSFSTSLEWQIVSEPTPVEKDEHIYDKGGVYVKVTDPSIKLFGYQLKVRPVYDYDIITLDDGRKMQVISAYDVYFEDENGNKPTYSPYDVFTVTYKTPGSVSADEIEIVYINPALTEHTAVSSALSSNKLEVSFEVSHFSIYAIAVEYEEPTPPPTEPGDKEEPKGGFNLSILLIIIALVLIVIIAIVLISKKKHRRRRYPRRRYSRRRRRGYYKFK